MRKLFIPALLVTLAALAAGCGQDSATPTTIPTTVPTTMPTTMSTSAPEMATPTTMMVDATATLAAATPTGELATVTSAAEATAAATATTGMEAQPTTAADSTPGADATTTTGNANTGPDLGDWTAVLAKMKTLTSYHQSAAITTGDAPINLESDIIPPDSAHIISTSTYSGTTATTEIITIGQDSWTKVQANGLDAGWVKSPNTIPTGTIFDEDSAGGFQNVTKAGDDTIDGTAATRYTFDVSSTQEGASSEGNGEAWIAKDSGYLLRIHLVATADVSGQTMTSDATITYSRFNDPTIKVEPPATASTP